jgi:hypothetical protein
MLRKFVTVMKKAGGLYHSNECARVASIQGSYLHLQRATGGRGLKHALLGRTSAPGSQASRLEKRGYLRHRPVLLTRTHAQRVLSIVIGTGGYLGRRLKPTLLKAHDEGSVVVATLFNI